MSFPPVPVYPKAIDDDYSLFLVYNTTETKICVENAAWADEIEIVPVGANKPEIWADNGFGNISGELFYYDAVEKDENDRVNKLKRCARNLGGKKTKHNPPGTWVRSFVVAEHHNQLVDAILKTEDFIGFNFDPRQKTLDWRIRNLEALELIVDDFACPDVVFTFNEISNSPIAGILTRYLVEITPSATTGNVSFRLDFGDGEFTTSELEGEHRYALNAVVDPVVTVSNDKCQIIQTPIVRDNPSQPPEIVEDVFSFPFPNTPTVPDFTFVPCEIPEPQLNLPPYVFPCISIEGGFPGIVEGPDINMVSQVFIEVTNPVNILYSTVTIEGGVNIPSYVFVDIPPTIVIDPPIPPTIVLIPDSSVQLSLNATELPRFEIDWGQMPRVTLTTLRAKTSPIDQESIDEFGDEFADIFEAQRHTKVEYEEVGIPEEIRIIPPKMPKIKFDVDNIPRSIKVDASEAKIPENIVIHGPETPIPSSITIHGPKNLPDQIELVSRDIPRTIELVSNTIIPQMISVVLESPIPSKITVETVGKIPESILVTGFPDSISVTGFPESIPVTGIPDAIDLRFPTEIPQMELVYKGSPIEFKIDFQPVVASLNEEGKYPCFMMMPCTK